MCCSPNNYSFKTDGSKGLFGFFIEKSLPFGLVCLPEKGPRKTPGKCKCKPDRTLPPPNTHLHICCIHAGSAMPTVVKISNFSFFIIYFATAALMIVFVSEILPEGGGDR